MTDSTFTAHDGAMLNFALDDWSRRQNEEAIQQISLQQELLEKERLLSAEIERLGIAERVDKLRKIGLPKSKAVSVIKELMREQKKKKKERKQFRARVRKNPKLEKDGYVAPHLRSRSKKTGLIPVSTREMAAMVERAGVMGVDPRFTYSVDPSLDGDNGGWDKFEDFVRNLLPVARPVGNLSPIMEEETEQQILERRLQALNRKNYNDWYLAMLADEKKLSLVQEIQQLSQGSSKKYKELEKKLKKDIAKAKKKLRVPAKERKRLDRMFREVSSQRRVVSPPKKRSTSTSSVGLLAVTPPRANSAPLLLRSPASRSPMLSPFPLRRPEKPIPIGKPGWEPPETYHYPHQKAVDLDTLRLLMLKDIKEKRATLVPRKNEFNLAKENRDEALAGVGGWRGRPTRRRLRILPGRTIHYNFDESIMDDSADNTIQRRKKERARWQKKLETDLAEEKAALKRAVSRRKKRRPTKRYKSPKKSVKRTPVRKRGTPSAKVQYARTKRNKSPIQGKQLFRSPTASPLRPDSPRASGGFRKGDVVEKIKGKGKGLMVKITRTKGQKVGGHFVRNPGKTVPLQSIKNFK